MNKIAITLSTPEKTTTVWEGEFRAAKPGESLTLPEKIKIFWDEDDSIPALLLDQNGIALRELGPEECDQIMDEGIVTHILHHHPRASRYGHPVCAANVPEIWLGTCGNLGFTPDPELVLETLDSGDDSAGSFLLTLKIPKTLKGKLDETTENAKKAAADVWKTNPITAGSMLGNACRILSYKTDEELEVSSHPDAKAVLAARRCIQSPCPIPSSQPPAKNKTMKTTTGDGTLVSPPPCPAFVRARLTNATVAMMLRAERPLDEIIGALAYEQEQYVKRIIDLESMAPRKVVMTDGEVMLWQGPAELAPPCMLNITTNNKLAP